MEGRETRLTVVGVARVEGRVWVRVADGGIGPVEVVADGEAAHALGVQGRRVGRLARRSVYVGFRGEGVDRGGEVVRRGMDERGRAVRKGGHGRRVGCLGLRVVVDGDPGVQGVDALDEVLRHVGLADKGHHVRVVDAAGDRFRGGRGRGRRRWDRGGGRRAGHGQGGRGEDGGGDHGFFGEVLTGGGEKGEKPGGKEGIGVCWRWERGKKRGLVMGIFSRGGLARGGFVAVGRDGDARDGVLIGAQGWEELSRHGKSLANYEWIF